MAADLSVSMQINGTNLTSTSFISYNESLSKMKQLEKRYNVQEVKGKSVKIDEEEWLRKNKDNNPEHE